MKFRKKNYPAPKSYHRQLYFQIQYSIIQNITVASQWYLREGRWIQRESWCQPGQNLQPLRLNSIPPKGK